MTSEKCTSLYVEVQPSEKARDVRDRNVTRFRHLRDVDPSLFRAFVSKRLPVLISSLSRQLSTTSFKMTKEDNVITAYPNYAPTKFTQVRFTSPRPHSTSLHTPADTS